MPHTLYYIASMIHVHVLIIIDILILSISTLSSIDLPVQYLAKLYIQFLLLNPTVNGSLFNVTYKMLYIWVILYIWKISQTQNPTKVTDNLPLNVHRRQSYYLPALTIPIKNASCNIVKTWKNSILNNIYTFINATFYCTSVLTTFK